MKYADDPPRLRQASDSPIDLVRALELSRSELPAPEEMARIAAGLQPMLSSSSDDASEPRARRAPASMRPVAAGATFAFKLLLAAAVAAGGLGTVLWRLRTAAWHETASLVGPTPSVAAPASKQTSPTSLDLASGAPTEPATAPTSPIEAHRAQAAAGDRAVTAQSAAPAARPSGSEPVGGAAFPDATSAAEAALLGRAERALASDPTRALRLTEEHLSRFPRGVLTQEREFVAIQALLGLGRRSDAAARAAQFHAHFPGSAHLRRLDLLLGAARDERP